MQLDCYIYPFVCLFTNHFIKVLKQIVIKAIFPLFKFLSLSFKIALLYNLHDFYSIFISLCEREREKK